MAISIEEGFEESKNKLSLLEWVKSNKNMEIKGFKNHLWNGVTCLQLSKLIFNFIKNNINWSGVRHIFSNQVSKYELVKYINEIYELFNSYFSFININYFVLQNYFINFKLFCLKFLLFFRTSFSFLMNN